MNKLNYMTNGLVADNPVLVQLLGMCATLATSTAALNGMSMGLATTAVLVGSNIGISALRKLIPDKIRIPSFVVVIATFVTIVDLLMHAYVPALYKQLGIFIPLIVVNCIIFARAEAFAFSHTVLESALDGLGMGIGFTLTLTVLGAFREILGAGTIFGISIFGESFKPVLMMIMPPGAFISLGLLIAAVNIITKKLKAKKA